MLGYTLALDFPANRRTLELMTSLDRIVVEHGGRFYLAKDARMPTDILEQSDKRVADFVAMRQERMLRAGFRSEQSERLGL